MVCMLTVAGGGCFNKAEDSSGGGSSNSDSFTGNMMDALKIGQSMKCTWSSQEGEGVSFIKNGKYYTESTIEGETGYMIYDGECSYTWEDGSTEGMQFCASPEDFEMDEADFDEEDYADQDYSIPGATDEQLDIDMNCTPAVISDSKFVPPSDITFADPLADLMDSLGDIDLSGLEGLADLEF